MTMAQHCGKTLQVVMMVSSSIVQKDEDWAVGTR